MRYTGKYIPSHDNVQIHALHRKNEERRGFLASGSFQPHYFGK